MTMRKAGESAAMTQITKDAVDIELTGGGKNERGEPQHGTLEVWHSHLLQRLTGADDASMKRYINRVTTMNFSFVLLCSWTGAAASTQLSLLNGGPASIVYGCIFAGIGTTFMAVSLAEMASMDPTVGAQYRWSATFAPKWNRFFGLMQGWICSTTSTTALVANLITGLAIFNFPDYTPERWHFTMIMWAATIVPFMMNLWCRKVITPLKLLEPSVT
ncbi:hypothetical protein E8E11_003023 [Didymella keratinophila]|nr:hypothetical protein E8E11_003023 [Didymella keratinophila]